MSRPKGRFWFWWSEIWHLTEVSPELNPGPYGMSERLERSARRALQRLFKRGEGGKNSTPADPPSTPR